MGLLDSRCDICGNNLTSYFQDEEGICYCSEMCYEKSLPKCTICNKTMNQWTETEDGKKYCSENCYKKSWHRCSICKQPMKEWIEAEDGNKYCSEECYKKTWHKCSICNKAMKQWTEDEDGKKYCSEECYKKSWHRCSICNKPMKEWYESEGQKVCSNECFLESCPTCDVCGKHTDNWIEDDKGKKFCSDNCRNKTLPTCNICGKHMDTWLVSKDGKTYCSEECFSHTLPRCMHCGKVMKEWLVTSDGRVYCSDSCISQSDIIIEKVNVFSNRTGLTINEIEALLLKNSWNLDDAILYVDNYMQSLEGKVTTSKVIVEGIKNAGIYDKLAKNLSSYNTMRGGQAGFKGFVFEDMHAANASINGTVTEVIGNNGLADFKILNPDGTYSFAQAKVGYNSSNIDWSAYKGQKIVIDKGNSKLINSARKAGMNVVESDITKADAQGLANKMQFESKLTGKPNAPFTSNLHSYHQAGIDSAKSGAAFGAGFSIGSNIVDLATGDKSIGEASAAIVKDTSTAAVSSYVIGAGTTALANTAVGTAVISEAVAVGGVVISEATAAGTVIAGTSVGAAAIAASTTVTTTAIAAGTAVTTTAVGVTTAVGSAIASTSVGATVISGATLATTTLGATAVGATIVAAAPLVVAGAVIGGVFSIGKKIFGRRW